MIKTHIYIYSPHTHTWAQMPDWGGNLFLCVCVCVCVCVRVFRYSLARFPHTSKQKKSKKYQKIKKSTKKKHLIYRCPVVSMCPRAGVLKRKKWKKKKEKKEEKKGCTGGADSRGLSPRAEEQVLKPEHSSSNYYCLRPSTCSQRTAPTAPPQTFLFLLLKKKNSIHAYIHSI
jgi:hypothetical protein